MLHYIAASDFASLGTWSAAFEHLAYFISQAEPESISDETPDLADMLIGATAAGHGQQVLTILGDARLAERLEPLRHAVRQELGETLEPLPAEIMSAVEEVQRRIAQKRQDQKSTDRSQPPEEEAR